MLNDTVSCILHNGYMSHFFAQINGLRQGCNLSPLLFIISAEIMANKIRQSNQIQGIEIPNVYEGNTEVKLTQFADDTTIFVKNKSSVTNVIKILDEFTEISGLHLNKAKCDTVWIGANRYSKKQVGNIHWKLFPNNDVKILGIVLNPCKKLEDMVVNWEPKMESVEKAIRSWTMRNLSMVGKILIIRSLLVSKFSLIFHQIA